MSGDRAWFSPNSPLLVARVIYQELFAKELNKSFSVRPKIDRKIPLESLEDYDF